MIDGEGDLAHADAGERRKAVENHHRWIDCAAYLGCMAIRVNAEGSGTDARVQINFGPQGMKWLQLEYAKLQAA